MKKPFAVGERVACYDQQRMVGVITKVISDWQYMVKIEPEDFDCEFHVKQLRRLVKRKPAREWWMNTHCLDLKSGTIFMGRDPFLSAEPVEGWTLVREVRPKK